MTALRFGLAVSILLLVAAGPASAGGPSSKEPTLLGRAILPSDAYQPGPPSGALVNPDNGVTPPFPGQPIPGFPAVLDAGPTTPDLGGHVATDEVADAIAEHVIPCATAAP